MPPPLRSARPPSGTWRCRARTLESVPACLLDSVAPACLHPCLLRVIPSLGAAEGLLTLASSGADDDAPRRRRRFSRSRRAAYYRNPYTDRHAHSSGRSATPQCLDVAYGTSFLPMKENILFYPCFTIDSCSDELRACTGAMRHARTTAPAHKVKNDVFLRSTFFNINHVKWST